MCGHALVEWGFEIPHSDSEWCVYAALFDVLYSTVPYNRQGATKGSGDLNRQLKVM